MWNRSLSHKAHIVSILYKILEILQERKVLSTIMDLYTVYLEKHEEFTKFIHRIIVITILADYYWIQEWQKNKFILDLAN